MSPVKMFEYMASKRPIIASGLPSIKEVLNDKNALLVKEGSSKDLAEGIKTILGNERLAEDLAAQAFIDVQEYSWPKRVGKILTFMKYEKNN
jgi:glycosyltransferase involved in cell wall biosynthesis